MLTALVMLSIILLLLMLAKGLSAAMHSVYLGMLCTVLVSQSQFSLEVTNHSKVLIIARPPDAGVAVLPGLGVGAVEVTGHGGHAEAGLAVLGQRTFKQTQCKYRYISSAYFSLIRTATTLYSRHDGTIDTIAIAEILNFQSYVFHVQSVFHVVNFTDDCS